MSQSLSWVLIHYVFSTKNRVAFLSDPSIRSEMLAYIAGICANIGSPSIIVVDTADHAHILSALNRNHSIADVIGTIKKNSSRWAKTKGGIFLKFQWQSGYGAFSVSKSHQDRVREYIARQESHHRKITFQDELRRLLRLHEVPFDERYLWD